MLRAHAASLFELKVPELNGGNGCSIIQTINSKTTKATARTTKSTSRVVCELSLFILGLIKMRCGGFLSPGLGGYCGEEIGGCGGPPWAAHKKLPHPLSPLVAHPMWVLPSLPVAELRFAASAGKEAQRGFRDTHIHGAEVALLQLPLEGTLPQSDGGRRSRPPGDLPPREAQERSWGQGLDEETRIQGKRKGHMAACVMSGVPYPAGLLSVLCRLFIRLQ